MTNLGGNLVILQRQIREAVVKGHSITFSSFRVTSEEIRTGILDHR